MAKKMKILGLGLPTLAVAGAAVWYFFIRKKPVTTTPVYRPGVRPITTPVQQQPISGLGREIEVF